MRGQRRPAGPVARGRRAAGRLLAMMLALAAAGGWRPAPAQPWADPGDVGLRHDIELLRDEGVLTVPVTTWPVSWPDLARALESVEASRLDGGVLAAYRRLQRRMWKAARLGWRAPAASLRGGARRLEYRWFADTPREPAEVGVRAGWLGGRTAASLRIAVAIAPGDGQRVRPDGSRVGVTFGNWMLSAGWEPRWWGPGWDGSLILSTNARPVPALAIQRKRSEPFRWPVLRWLGPWTLVFFTGVLEEDRAVPRPLLTGLRVAFSPYPGLEVGLSRTAQWGGRGRPTDLEVFVNLMLGRDNRDEIAGGVTREPGNQLAGWDVRWRLPRLPVVAWFQMIGEDEAGGMLAREIGLGGIAVWGHTEGGSTWRVRAEYSDTTASFFRERVRFNTTYEHGIYRSGYRYRGRSLGHGTDNDTRLLSLGGIWVTPAGRTLALTVRRASLNRDGGGSHPIAPTGARSTRVDLEAWGRVVRAGLDAGAGVSLERLEPRGGAEPETRLGAWIGVTARW